MVRFPEFSSTYPITRGVVLISDNAVPGASLSGTNAAQKSFPIFDFFSSIDKTNPLKVPGGIELSIITSLLSSDMLEIDWHAFSSYDRSGIIPLVSGVATQTIMTSAFFTDSSALELV